MCPEFLFPGGFSFYQIFEFGLAKRCAELNILLGYATMKWTHGTVSLCS